MTEKDLRWNRFIDEICSLDFTVLSDVQRNAVLCFWYDAEMNNGGHCGYADCYPMVAPECLVAALTALGCPELAENYQKAVTEGEMDDWAETDRFYHTFVPSLIVRLQAYVEDNRNLIFNKNQKSDC